MPEIAETNDFGVVADGTPALLAASLEGQEVLDLTNAHLRNLDGVSLPDGLQVLDLTCNRLSEIDPRILALTGLRSLNFRQNLLADASLWNSCSCNSTLEDLEFRDNQITQIPKLEGFTSLRRLEFSYNEIRSLAPLTSLDSSNLSELYVASNKITAITGISHLTQLTVLELGSNRIKTIEQLDSLGRLQELWLGRNRIQHIAGLSALTNLKRISIQSNRLESISGLEECTALEELYLSHNGISRLEGLHTLSRLTVLDVSNNRIARVEGLDSLGCLEDLWLNDNLIENFPETEEGLRPVADSLVTIYLEKNPLAKDPSYHSRLKALLPKLVQLDANSLIPLKARCQS